MSTRRLPVHYGWLIVLTGNLCIFACIGIGRFALGMLLPSMGNSLNLTYSQMGLIGTFNFIGYLAAVLACSLLVTRLGSRRLIFFALLLVASSMALISYCNSFYSVALFYLLTGLGSGAANVPMMALVSTWFTSRHRGKAAGFIAIGSGFAILLSGKLIPFLNSHQTTEGWRLSWLILGLIVFLVAFICLLIIRDRPEELGLTPVGSKNFVAAETATSSPLEEKKVGKATIYHLGAIYFLFGSTYVIYATFMVTSLVQERGFTETAAGDLWAWVGVLSLLSGPVFGSLSDRLGRKAGLVMVFTIQMLAYLLIAANLPGLSLYLSVFCYGIVAWSIPTIMAALVGDYVGPAKAARVFGFITFIFALGQIAGPYVAGILAEISGSFTSSFIMAALLAGTAVLLCLLLERPPAAPGTELS